MKRKYLEDLGLEKDVIDKIMKENGIDIEAEKAKAKAIEDTVEDYKKQLEETSEKLKTFEGLDVEGIKAQVSEWQQKYEKDTNELKAKNESIEYNHKLEKFISGFDFASEFAKKAVVSELSQKGFKFDGDTLLGGKDFIEEIRQKDPNAFKPVETEEKKPPASWVPGDDKQQSNQQPPKSLSIGDALKEQFSKQK